MPFAVGNADGYVVAQVFEEKDIVQADAHQFSLFPNVHILGFFLILNAALNSLQGSLETQKGNWLFQIINHLIFKSFEGICNYRMR